MGYSRFGKLQEFRCLETGKRSAVTSLIRSVDPRSILCPLEMHRCERARPSILALGLVKQEQWPVSNEVLIQARRRASSVGLSDSPSAEGYCRVTTYVLARNLRLNASAGC